MKQFYEENKLEVGIDEVARGCLAGRVYTAAVIWPPNLEDEEIHPLLRDSKKLSRKQRNIVKEYIEDTAIDFAIGYESPENIDKFNILNATHMLCIMRLKI